MSLALSDGNTPDIAEYFVGRRATLSFGYCPQSHHESAIAGPKPDSRHPAAKFPMRVIAPEPDLSHPRRFASAVTCAISA